MAKSAKPRKKYKPKYSVIGKTGNIGMNTMLANKLAILATSNQPLDQPTIEDAVLPLRTFMEKLKDGTATEQIFYDACCYHYRYITLLDVLRRTPIKADENVEMLVRIENSIKYEIAVDETINIFTEISDRSHRTGKWIATGDEIRHMEKTEENMRATLNLISWQHYIQALKESEKVLDDEHHKMQKRKVTA